MRTSPCLLLLGLIFAGGTPESKAIDYNWRNVDGVWADPTRWDPIGPPGPSDRAVFDGGESTVSIATPTFADEMWVGEENLTVLCAAPLTLGNFIVAPVGEGWIVDLAAGILTAGTSYIGQSPNSYGTVNVRGPSTHWLTSGRLYIGDVGQAKVVIESGATAPWQSTTP